MNSRAGRGGLGKAYGAAIVIQSFHVAHLLTQATLHDRPTTLRAREIDDGRNDCTVGSSLPPQCSMDD